MLEVPVRGVLVGAGEGQHLGVGEEFADEGEAGGVTLFVEAVGDGDAGVAGEVGHGAVESGDGIGRVVGVIKRDEVDVDLGHDASHLLHEESAHAVGVEIVGGGKQAKSILAVDAVLADKLGGLGLDGIAEGGVGFAPHDREKIESGVLAGSSTSIS